MTEFVNNSGQGPQAVAPAEVLTGFNWGAFFLNWIWGLGNKTYIALLSLVAGFVPFIGGLIALGLIIWFGIKGNEWAWQNKKWESVEHFHSVQKTWATWGIVLFVLGIVLGILGALLFGAAAVMGGAQ